jgi:cytochrome c biogenesis protein CcdA/thiol-disulfide isomerase/thioredoxin
MRVLLVVLAALFGMGQTASRAVDVSPIVESDGVHAGRVVRVALKVDLPAGFHVQSDAPRDPTLIATTLGIDPPSGIEAVDVAYPASSDFAQEGSAQPLSVFGRQFLIGARLRITASEAPGEKRVPARLRYQMCDDKMCFKPVSVDVEWRLRIAATSERVTATHAESFAAISFDRTVPAATRASIPPPAAAPAAGVPTGLSTGSGLGGGVTQLDRFVIRGSEGGYLGTSEFLQFVRDAEAGVKKRGLFDGRGPIAILAIVFLGGLALNLTPCVLPMIPINLAIIGAGARSHKRGRGFLLGATYGGAMAVVYGVLGLIVILTAGTFGTINASPWFNLAIAAFFVVLGLAMFDVLNIDFSRLSSRVRFSNESRGTFYLAFGMGAIAALLAGACVAPVVIQVVLFASQLYTSGNASALALPFVLGLGMALPWPVAGAGFAALPKPGAWMNTVKYVLGVFILITAAYYGYLAYSLFANRWVDPAAVSASVEEKLKSGWHASLADGLAAAERDGTPVVIDLWATWCKNCLTMDKTTLANPEVVAALSRYTRIKVQAEDPDAQPIREIMRKLGAVGLPTYVILYPKARTE